MMSLHYPSIISSGRMSIASLSSLFVKEILKRLRYVISTFLVPSFAVEQRLRAECLHC